jgi:hypothetical protein
VTLDGKPFVLRQDLVKKPCPPACPAQIGVRAGGDQVAVQDRLDDVLQARPLSDDLVAPGDLPAKRLCRFVRNPDFRQKAACIKLREDAGVDRIGLDPRMSDDADLLGVCDHDLLDMRRDRRRDRGRVAGRFDDNHLLLGELLRESLENVAAHVDAPQSFELAVVPGDRLGEGAVDIQSDDAHAPSVFVRSKGELAGDTTSTDPRSERIRESRKGRPCNELGLSAHCLSAACPHLRAPGAPCPRWAHHITVFLSGNRRTARRRRTSYRILVDRRMLSS